MRVNKIRKIEPTYKEACELYGYKLKDKVDFETRISNECFNLDEYFTHEILIHILYVFHHSHYHFFPTLLLYSLNL